MNQKCAVYQDKMHKSVEVMKKEFGAIRAGRANPAVLDKLSVEYFGSMMPVNQLASISSPESLYSEELVTFEESSYDQTNATGFINLWGLPDTVLALREQGKL